MRKSNSLNNIGDLLDVDDVHDVHDVRDQKSDKDLLSSLNPICNICKEILLFPSTLGCGHNFCHSCLKDYHNHCHRGNNRNNSNNRNVYDDEGESDSSDSQDSEEYRTVIVPSTVSTDTDTDTGGAAFATYNDFRTSNLELGTNSDSKFILDRDEILSTIFRESVFCDNCPNLSCPTCRLNVKVLPTPNILLHETLKNILGDVYLCRMDAFLQEYSEKYVIESYEKSERFKTIMMLVRESLSAIEQAVKFDMLMQSFSAYGEEEIIWCLHKLLSENAFVVVKDFIISHNHYSSDFLKALREIDMPHEDIIYLIVWHPKFTVGNDSLKNALKKKFKPRGEGSLALLNNKKTLEDTFKRFIIANKLYVYV